MAIDREFLGHEQAVVNYVVERWHDFKTARTGKEKIWSECTDMYMSKFSPAIAEWLRKNGKSMRYIGLPWDAVETVYSQVMNQLFPGDQWLKLRPSEPGGFKYDDSAAKGVQQLLYQQHRQSRFKQVFGNGCVKQLIVLGSAPVTNGWEIEWATDFPKYAAAMTQHQKISQDAWQKHLMMVEQFQQQIQVALEQGADPSQLPQEPPFESPPPPTPDEKISYQGPTLECDDLFNFVIDPYPNRRSSALRIKRAFKSLAYLKQYSEPDEAGYVVYENLDKLSEVDLLSSSGVTDSQLAQRAAAFGLNIPKNKRGVDLLEAQGDMEIALDPSSGARLFLNYTVTIGNEKHLLRAEPGFLWINRPATHLVTICNPPGEIYGTGLLEPNRGTNEVIQARTNQLIEGVSAAINPEYKCVDDGIIDIQAISAPGKKHLMANLNNMEPLNKNLSGIHLAMNDYARLKGEFQQGTRSANASVPMYEKSATEIMQSSGVVGATLAQIVREIEDNGLCPIIQAQICMNAMYITEPVMAFTIQAGVADWMPVSPYEVRRGWLVEVVGSQHIAEKSQRVQDKMFFAQMTGGNPVYAPFVRHLQLLKSIYAEFGTSDTEEMFVDEQTGKLLLIEMMMNGTLMGHGSKGATGNGQPSQGARPAGAGGTDAASGGEVDAAGGSGAWVSDDDAIPSPGLLGAMPGFRP